MKESRSPWESRVQRTTESNLYLPWLKEGASLTARIQGHCSQFAVNCLQQHLTPLRRDESGKFNLRTRTLARSRSVILLADGKPVVFARTVMPVTPRHPFDRYFQALGSRSLGSLLFSSTSPATRTPLEFAHLDQRHFLYRQARLRLPDIPPKLWARRSVFSWGTKKLMVTELFLPEILQLSRIRAS